MTHFKINSFIFACILIICTSSGALFFIFNYPWVDFSALEQQNPGLPTILLDNEGREWARFEWDRAQPVPFEQMPRHLINAFIAAEDWQFFSHQGISWKGIARSTWVNLYNGRIVQGASTITQQLVKLLLLDSQRTFSRKIKEQLYAIVVERQFTKEQILQTYLNNVYFGCGIYGVQAASQRFWGVDVSELTVDQSALLAAIVRCPAQYCPLLCPLSGTQRRNIILYTMAHLKLIDADTYNTARAQPVWTHPQATTVIAPHLKETIRAFLHDMFGKTMLYTGGLIVQTTINSAQQLHAQHAFEQHCATLRTELLPNIDGGLIALETKTGAICALVGGFDFMTSKFNRALQARRQLGSIFKPLIYAAAVTSDFDFSHTYIDEPTEFMHNNAIWAPNNWDNNFYGQMTLAHALSNSNNIVTIKTLLDVGIDPVIALAKKTGIAGPFHPYPSLALGCVDATLYEAVGMFNLFANNGVYVQPHYISWIKDKSGQKIFKHTPITHRVLSSTVNDQVAHVLTLGLHRIRSRFGIDAVPHAEVISKTGTTNDWRSSWFVGSTPELTTGIYMGSDDNSPLSSNGFPIKTAVPIWLAFNKKIPCTQKRFSFDPALQEICINEFTGKQMPDCTHKNSIKILV